MNSLLDLSANCGIYFSGNYGTTWYTFNNNPNLSYSINSITCSSSGQNVFWICDASNSINYSNNYLSNLSINVPNIGSPNLNSIACSSSGLYMIASAGQSNGGFLTVSNGYNFVTNLSGISFNNVACSGTGQYMFADASNGELYISNDYGTSWASPITIPSSAIISSSCCSTSGQYLYLADSTNGTIYTYSQNMDIGNIYGSSIQELQLSTQLIPQLPALIQGGTSNYFSYNNNPYFPDEPDTAFNQFVIQVNPGLYIFNSVINAGYESTSNVFLINSNLYYVLDGNNNKLSIAQSYMNSYNISISNCCAFTLTNQCFLAFAITSTVWGYTGGIVNGYYSLVQLA